MVYKPSFFILSDHGVAGASLAVGMASKISDDIVWICGENPLLANRISKAYDLNIEIFGNRSFNLANLNEINILITKCIEKKDRYTVILSILPELILVHNLDRVYLFLLNLFKKIESDGFLVGLMIKHAQNIRDEIIISRLFSDVFYLKSELNSEPEFRLISEAPINDRYVFKLKLNGYVIDMEEDIVKYLKEVSQA